MTGVPPQPAGWAAPAWRWFRARPLWAQALGWLLAWWLLAVVLLWRAPLAPRWKLWLSGGWAIIVLAIFGAVAGAGGDDGRQAAATATPAPRTAVPLVATSSPVPTASPARTPSPTRTPSPSPSPSPARTASVPPTPSPTPGPRAVTEASAPCLDGQIKANRNSGIYHQPGQRDYERTTANVACFDTEAEAVAAGYRRAQR